MNLFLPWWAPHVRHHMSRGTAALATSKLLLSRGGTARQPRQYRLLPNESPAAVHRRSSLKRLHDPREHAERRRPMLAFTTKAP
eukprot:7105044-Alexandrium_andersonii.AAC.1